MENLQTLIFIGQSGCGKGTQAELLRDELAHRAPEIPTFYLQTGFFFREFIAQAGYSNEHSRTIMGSGTRQPDFLAIWMWANVMIENVKNVENLIIDGSPRSLNEAKTLHTALEFYERKRPTIIFLNVSRAWSEARLLSRGRTDDQDLAEVKKRLDWFENDVMPAVDYYRNNSAYRFLDINGEQPIEDVQKDIVARVFESA